MSSNKTTIEKIGPFGRCLACADNSDFDGHTEFATLTAEQRLQWLSEIAVFTAEARRHREPFLAAGSILAAP